MLLCVLCKGADMWKHLFVFSILAYGVVLGYSDKLISKGKWVVEKTERCEDYESYPYDFHLQKKKMNRTHDVFYGHMEVLEDLTENDFGLFVVACKKVDGGCKTVISVDEESFCQFLKKQAEKNFRRFLKSMDARDDCPILKGRYELKDFMFDNTELPDEGLVGSFLGTAILVKKNEKLMCYSIHLRFEED